MILQLFPGDVFACTTPTQTTIPMILQLFPGDVFACTPPTQTVRLRGLDAPYDPPTDRLAVVVAADGSQLLTGHCPIEVESRIELELHP